MSAPARPPGALPADHPRAPRYWKHETSGLLALAVAAFINDPLGIAQTRDMLRAMGYNDSEDDEEE